MQIQHHSARHHGGDLAALLHRSEHVDRARQRLRGFVQDELATYCLHALTAAGTIPSPEAAQRLVTVTLAGLIARRR